MSYQFEEAKPVAVTGTGRKAADNPFTGIIAEIALKKDSQGEPVARSFTEEYDDAEQLKTVSNRIRRFMSEAGAKNDPAVTVRIHETDAVDGKGKVVPNTRRFTFWTVTRQTRTRTASPETVEASE